MRHIVGLAMAVLLSAPTARAQEAPVVLQPSSRWQVNYADNECQLLRSFGTGDQMVALRFARSASSDTYDFVLAGPALPSLSRHLRITMRLDPQGIEAQYDGFSSRLDGQDGRFLRIFDADVSLLSQFTPDQIMTVRAQDTVTRLNLTNVRAALAALQTCRDDLLTSWGFDLAAYRALQSPPIPIGNEANWVRSEDYPSTWESGLTTVRLVVGASGSVSSCAVVVTSGEVRLDNAACNALSRRARFEPAIGADGAPTEASVLKRVRWIRP